MGKSRLNSSSKWISLLTFCSVRQIDLEDPGARAAARLWPVDFCPTSTTVVVNQCYERQQQIEPREGASSKGLTPM